MIVEFIGTPGSGKSTLVPVLVKILAERNYLARTIIEASRPVISRTILGKGINKFSPKSIRDPLLWQVFSGRSYIARKQFSKKHPALVSHVQRTQQARDIPDDELEHILYWWFHLIGYYQLLMPRILPHEVLILDEGFAHRVVQLHASDHEDLDQDNLSTYLHLIPRPDILIFIEAPAAECEKRIYDRGLWSRFEHKTPKQVSQYITNSHQVVKTAVEIVKSQGWDLIQIDNSGHGISSAEGDLRSKVLYSLDEFAMRNLSSAGH